MPVEDAVIRDRLKKLLLDVDMATTTERKLREALEAELGEDLSGRKPLIRQEVNEYLLQQQDAEDLVEDGQACGENGVPDDHAAHRRSEASNAQQGEEEDAHVKRKKKRKRSAFGSILSEPLQVFLGEKSMPRTEVVKRLWVYIKAHELQNPKNKRKIILDDKLKTLFKAPLTMFTMNKQLSRHVFASDASHEETGARHEEIDDDEDIEIDFEEDEEEKEEEDPKKEPAKLRKAGSNMFSAVERKAARKKAAQEGGEEVAEERPQKRASGPAGGASRLSPEMQSFLGVQQMSRPQVVKAIWKYIKDQGLQDPEDKRAILPDAKLRIILTPPVNMFSMQKQISKHIFPANSE